MIICNEQDKKLLWLPRSEAFSFQLWCLCPVALPKSLNELFLNLIDEIFLWTMVITDPKQILHIIVVGAALVWREPGSRTSGISLDKLFMISWIILSLSGPFFFSSLLPGNNLKQFFFFFFSFRKFYVSDIL